MPAKRTYEHQGPGFQSVRRQGLRAKRSPSPRQLLAEAAAQAERDRIRLSRERRYALADAENRRNQP